MKFLYFFRHFLIDKLERSSFFIKGWNVLDEKIPTTGHSNCEIKIKTRLFSHMNSATFRCMNSFAFVVKINSRQLLLIIIVVFSTMHIPIPFTREHFKGCPDGLLIGQHRFLYLYVSFRRRC
jgi:hypothetical protein